MTAFTVTVPQNIDALSPKTGGDTYAINGGTLTIDQDTRYGVNATTSASMGSITISSTLGGKCNIDGRYVRLIPYTGGSGTVPSSGTTISRGGGQRHPDLSDVCHHCRAHGSGRRDACHRIHQGEGVEWDAVHGGCVDRYHGHGLRP